MNETLIAASPWICIGIAAILYGVNYILTKKAKEQGKQYGNFMTEGMCLGLTFGMLAGGNGMIYGALIGLVIGMFWKKTRIKEKDEN